MTLSDLRALPNEKRFAPLNERNSLYAQMAGATGTRQFYVIDGYTFTEESVHLTHPSAFDGFDIMKSRIRTMTRMRVKDG